MSNVAANIGREEGEKVEHYMCKLMVFLTKIVMSRVVVLFFKLLNCAIAHIRWLAMSFADYTIRIRVEVIEPYCIKCTLVVSYGN